MLKLTNRYVPDHVCPDASIPITENIFFVTRNSRETKDYVDGYTRAFIMQAGAVEFKTLNDLEKVYEEE
jgi:hypothetical protein